MSSLFFMAEFSMVSPTKRPTSKENRKDIMDGGHGVAEQEGI